MTTQQAIVTATCMICGTAVIMLVIVLIAVSKILKRSINQVKDLVDEKNVSVNKSVSVNVEQAEQGSMK